VDLSALHSAGASRCDTFLHCLQAIRPTFADPDLSVGREPDLLKGGYWTLRPDDLIARHTLGPVNTHTYGKRTPALPAWILETAGVTFLDLTVKWVMGFYNGVLASGVTRDSGVMWDAAVVDS